MSRTAGADARRGHSKLGGDLSGVETCHEPECEERAVVRLQAGEGTGEVDDADPVRGVGARRRVERLADVDDRAVAALANRLTGLVRGDCHQPRPDLRGVAQRREPAPGDGPGTLDRVTRGLRVSDTAYATLAIDA